MATGIMVPHITATTDRIRTGDIEGMVIIAATGDITVGMDIIGDKYSPDSGFDQADMTLSCDVHQIA